METMINFEEKMKIANLKLENEKFLIQKNIEFRNNLFKEYSKNLIDFLNYINENYLFNEFTEYKTDKKLFTKKIDIKNISFLDKCINSIENRNYISFFINNENNFIIELSHNKVRNFKIFNSVNDFIEYFSYEILKIAKKIN